MKKYFYFLLLAIAPIALISCGDDEEKPEQEENSKYILSPTNILGVWEGGGKIGAFMGFISFSPTGFYSACLDDHTLDEGTYTISGDEITIKNAYRGLTTRYKFISIDEKKCVTEVSYTDTNNTSKTETYTFYKTKDEPCEKEHFFTGKTFTGTYAYSDYTTIYTSYNTMSVSAYNRTSKKTTNRTFYYVLLGTRWKYTIMEPIKGHSVDVRKYDEHFFLN